MKFIEPDKFTLELSLAEIDIIVDLLANVQLGEKKYQGIIKDMLHKFSDKGLNDFNSPR